MNTIDKIRAEIDRRLKRENEILWNAKLRGTAYPPSVDDNLLTLTSLRDFLDTLEEPVSEDLEEAANDHIRKVVDAAGHPGWDWETQDISDAFKAGAEWQKAKMMEGATYNELMELYRAIRDELVKRHRDVPVNIKEKQ